MPGLERIGDESEAVGVLHQPQIAPRPSQAQPIRIGAGNGGGPPLVGEREVDR